MGLCLILGKRRLKLQLWATNNKIIMCILQLMMYWLRKTREGRQAEGSWKVVILLFCFGLMIKNYRTDSRLH